MRKLIHGIIDFRNTISDTYRERFSELALGQAPDTLFVACSDSRVAPNVFASTDPGDMFVIRNVGNLIPPCGHEGISAGDESEVAAIEFALTKFNVSDIVVCGHSECGACQAMLNPQQGLPPHLSSWLRHGKPALRKLGEGKAPDNKLERHNQLSQLNVLQQVEHLKSYEIVRERIADGRLRVHGWWFDIANVDVYSFNENDRRFELITERTARRLIRSKEERAELSARS